MKKILYSFTAVILLAAFYIWPQIVKGDEYEKGKEAYANRCQMCHGSGGKGDGPASAAFDPKPANFTNPRFWQQKNVDLLITDTVENGHGKMPALNLHPDEIKLIISYISHAFKK